MNRKKLLESMLMKLSKERVVDIAAELLLDANEIPTNRAPDLEEDPQPEPTRSRSRITTEDVELVLSLVNPATGQLPLVNLSHLVDKLGRSAGSIKQIARKHWKPKITDLFEKDGRTRKEPTAEAPVIAALMRGSRKMSTEAIDPEAVE